MGERDSICPVPRHPPTYTYEDSVRGPSPESIQTHSLPSRAILSLKVDHQIARRMRRDTIPKTRALAHDTKTEELTRKKLSGRKNQRGLLSPLSYFVGWNDILLTRRWPEKLRARRRQQRQPPLVLHASDPHRRLSISIQIFLSVF